MSRFNLKNAFHKPYFNPRQTLWLLLSVFIFMVDQLIKYWAARALVLYQPRPLTAFFNLTLAHNTGAAFSFLADAGQKGRGFLIIFAIAMSFFLLAWLLRLSRKQSLLSIAIALVLGGALGNLLDRIRYGYVIDFMDVYASRWHWPAFNIADSAICIGLFILIVNAFKK